MKAFTVKKSSRRLIQFTLSGLLAVSISLGGALSHAGQDQNVPTPELGPKVEAARLQITRDPKIQKAIKTDRALKALSIQVLNQLKHVSFSFSKRDASYTHDYVIAGPYPKVPTEIALRKAQEFIEIFYEDSGAQAPAFIPVDRELEAKLLEQQQAVAKKVTTDSLNTYLDMSKRLKTQGPEAPFAEELGPVVLTLEHKLKSDPLVAELCKENKVLANMRALTLKTLESVIHPASGKPAFPYLSSIEAIQRAMEFMDVLQREHDPTRSPKLYHSDRYDYYGHYLKGEIPDHIILPTLVNLGSTDILKARGVPISFIGVNTDIKWVDGFFQTPYEFWVHDINHSRRMFQFFKETAAALGLTIEEFAIKSDKFVKEKLLPLFSIKKHEQDNPIIANKKRLIKMVLFEILHEDALAADPSIIKTAMNRPPNLITPFETIEGTNVVYVMEPGATTLAYVFRKLAHNFYDMPGERIDNIVAPEFRTRENIVEAAEIVLKALGFTVQRELLEYFVSTDQGFPKDFRHSIQEDADARVGQVEALDQEVPEPKEQVRLTVANLFHESWQKRSGYSARWKPSRGVFKDGTGVNDGFTITEFGMLMRYFKEKQIPEELHRYFKLDVNPDTGKIELYEDIQHLPNKYLAPNNQFENLSGASNAVSLIESLVEQKTHLNSVDEGVAWLKDALQTMNLDWLRRNGIWAKSDPSYNVPWSQLSATRQQNGLTLLKVSLETQMTMDPRFLPATQVSLIQEAIRRVELEVRKKAASEVQVYVTADRIHEYWQKNSGYGETGRWKPAIAALWNGTPVTSPAILKEYFVERKIPPKFQNLFEFREDEKTGKVVLFEDIQHIPNNYLAPNHQQENVDAAKTAVQIVDRFWNNSIRFKNGEDAKRWLKAAAQAVHQAVLDRNANGAKDNPVYYQHWSKLPARNQLNDLAHVEIAFEGRFKFFQDSISEDQRTFILEGLKSIRFEISAQLGTSGAACDPNLDKKKP